MVSLADWLESHKEKLIAAAVENLTGRDAVRQQAEGPVRWFFDSLIRSITQGQHEHLETLLRNWVNLCSVPINGEPVGLLPVIGVFKRVIWAEFKADPPPDSALELAIEIDAVLSQSAEFLSRIEAAALMEEVSHAMSQTDLTHVSKEDSVKNNFVSVAAHELKTPLTVIEGYTNMLKMELPSEFHPRAMLLLQGLDSGIARLRELIEDMIDVSLIEMDLMSLDLQPTWLRRVWDIVELDISEAAKQRNLTVEIKRDTIPNHPTVGDPERLFKAFLKVLNNAIKYTPDGGRITVAAHESNDFVDITIQDTGIGIQPENLERIFQKFSAIGDITRHSSGKVKFRGGGAGLGLVIARGIIEAHNGTIWADSTGQDEHGLPGSTFHIMLPMRRVELGDGLSPLVASIAEIMGSSLLIPDQASESPDSTHTPVQPAEVTPEQAEQAQGPSETAESPMAPSTETSS